MYTIVGLGNPGKEYELTRHNAGQIILTEAFREDDFSESDLYSGRAISREGVRVLFPDTYMNESGREVVKLVGREAADQLIVVYDDVDLPIGELKISVGRGDGGHNGVTSIINHLKTKNFVRIRVGVARKNFWGKVVRPRGDELAKFVLTRFSKAEVEKIKELSKEVKEAIDMIVKDGVDRAMNKFN